MFVLLDVQLVGLVFHFTECLKGSDDDDMPR
jgi:hypothetical protein